jgi:D-3-phosphoglycerate dehydrogenase
VGAVGTFLGNRNINIAGMQVGRLSVRGSRAVMALSVDDDVSHETLNDLRKIKGVSSCRLLTF